MPIWASSIGPSKHALLAGARGGLLGHVDGSILPRVELATTRTKEARYGYVTQRKARKARKARVGAARVEQPEWVLSESSSRRTSSRTSSPSCPDQGARRQGDVPRVAPRLEGDAEEAREAAPARVRRPRRHRPSHQLAGAVRPFNKRVGGGGCGADACGTKVRTAVLDGKLYAAGGMSGADNFASSNLLERYDPALDAWEEVAPM